MKVKKVVKQIMTKENESHPFRVERITREEQAVF
jgi:hypothetical protein